MTVIVAIKTTDGVVMAGDLLASNGWTKGIVATDKVFSNGEFLMGYTSSFRMGQLLQYNFCAPERPEGLSDDQYLHTRVIPTIQNLFRSNGYGGSEKDGDKGGTFLLAYRGEIYTMQNDFSLLKYDDPVVAVGCGDVAAVGYATALVENTEMSVEAIITACIEHAGNAHTGVGGMGEIHYQNKA